MPHRAQQRPDTGQRYSQAEVDAIVEAARASQQAHDVKGTQQARIGAETMAAKVAAELAPHLRGGVSDVPVWLKIVGAIGGVVLTGFGILAIVWQAAIAPVTGRLEVLERSGTAAAAAATSTAARLQTVEGKAAQIETAISTATRIRDQQQQAMLDQIRGLSAADQSGAERLANLANTIAGILPRLEEILRRQERLENRLGARSGAAAPQDQPVRMLPSNT